MFKSSEKYTNVHLKIYAHPESFIFFVACIKKSTNNQFFFQEPSRAKNRIFRCTREYFLHNVYVLVSWIIFRFINVMTLIS
jgi:hypothetical protein